MTLTSQPPTSAPAGPSVEELVDLFLAVMGRLGRHFFECSAEFDLSPQQAKALRELDQPLSMKELADRLLCDASNVTGIVDRLEARGLVERQPDPGDRRVKRLVLTATGRELWQAHHDRVFGSEIPALTALTPDDRRALHGLLSRMDEAGPAVQATQAGSGVEATPAGRQQDGVDQPS